MCKFLPSPHHRNPNFRLPWQKCASPPQTPLNTELLSLFEHAQHSIFIQTPNITCPPVLDAVLAALERGVNVRITTSERLMILEQLVTAGTTTSRCVKRLIERYERLISRQWDQEAGRGGSGELHISYYEPRASREQGVAEPVQSHLKLTVVDNEVVVFGSGNMDRASWFTSQELGVAFYSSETVKMSVAKLEQDMVGRTRLRYDSTKL
jgi:phosphatidylserine/phosphatidylglycerophosphate/cardiolipin synthase-like enzyme